MTIVGLFLGYTILQAPTMFMAIWGILKKMLGMCFSKGHISKVNQNHKDVTLSKDGKYCWKAGDDKGIVSAYTLIW